MTGSTRYSGHTLARAWLSVALASSKDTGRPQLDRTVLVEQYREGLRLVATDSHVLPTPARPKARWSPRWP